MTATTALSMAQITFSMTYRKAASVFEMPEWLTNERALSLDEQRPRKI